MVEQFLRVVDILRHAGNWARFSSSCHPIFLLVRHDLSELENLLDGLHGHRVAVEFRNRNWVDAEQLTTTRSFLSRHSAAFVSVDAPAEKHFTIVPSNWIESQILPLLICGYTVVTPTDTFEVKPSPHVSTMTTVTKKFARLRSVLTGSDLRRRKFTSFLTIIISTTPRALLCDCGWRLDRSSAVNHVRRNFFENDGNDAACVRRMNETTIASPRPSWWKRFKDWWRIHHERLISIEDTPHSIALGVAIGIFFGFTPLWSMKTLFFDRSGLAIQQQQGRCCNQCNSARRHSSIYADIY